MPGEGDVMWALEAELAGIDDEPLRPAPTQPEPYDDEDDFTVDDRA